MNVKEKVISPKENQETIISCWEAMAAFSKMRDQAADVPEMSPEEIDEEIRAARAERGTKRTIPSSK